MPYLLKYYLGASPWETPAAPIIALHGTSNENLVLEFSRARSTPDATGFVEWSETLAPDSWFTTGVTVEIIEQTATHEHIRATVPTTVRDRHFLRLRVTHP